MTRGRKRLDIIGHTFNNWLVLEEVEKKEGSKIRRYRCQCICGTEKIVYQNTLTSGKGKSCGCQQRRNWESKALKLEDQTFGRLTVLHRLGSKRGMTNWLCKCSCGGMKEATSQALRQGHTKSCGCIRKERAAQGVKNRQDKLKAKEERAKHKNPRSAGVRQQNAMCAERRLLMSKRQRELEGRERISIKQKMINMGIKTNAVRYR